VKLNSSVTQHNDGCVSACFVSRIVDASYHVLVIVESVSYISDSL